MKKQYSAAALAVFMLMGSIPVMAVAAENAPQIVVDGVAVGEEAADQAEWVDGQAPVEASVGAEAADAGADGSQEVQESAADIANGSVGLNGTEPASAGTIGAVGAGTPVASVQASQLPDAIEFDDASVAYEGTWVPFADGFQIYLPSEWNYYVITDEERAEGIIYKAGQEDGSCSLAVTYAATSGATAEDLAQWYQDGGLSGVRLVEINSIPCVTYRAADGSYKGVSFLMDDGNLMFAIAFAPGDDAANLGDTVLCSVKPY